jgi:hypothetical protein
MSQAGSKRVAPARTQLKSNLSRAPKGVAATAAMTCTTVLAPVTGQAIAKAQRNAPASHAPAGASQDERVLTIEVTGETCRAKLGVLPNPKGSGRKSNLSRRNDMPQGKAAGQQDVGHRGFLRLLHGLKHGGELPDRNHAPLAVQFCQERRRGEGRLR